jgi:membrane protein implicated in regulation of membrane protease activity
VTLVWIAVALVFAIVEVVTVALVAGFIALGATGAAIAAFVGGSLTDQAIVFAVVSLLGLALARHPLLVYLQDRSAPETASGAAGMIGQTAVVVDPIGDEHHRGHVRIAGEDWPALTRDGRPVDAGVPVRVVEIRLATLIVEPAPNGSREGSP